MIEREIELEDCQEALESVRFLDLMQARLRHEDAARELKEAFSTILDHLHNKLGISPADCCKLVLYNGVVALMSTPEYEPSNP